MIGLGGILVPAEDVKQLETDIEVLCKSTGFPEGEVFKWSPQPKHWMSHNLLRDDRCRFQLSILELLFSHGCKCVFIAEDKNCACAERTSDSHEIDIVKLLVERVDWFFRHNETTGFIICDRPGGDYKQEEKYLATCLDTVRKGTTYLVPSTINMAILSCPSRLSRLLQAADLIVSCTLAYVCGEIDYSPVIVEQIKPLFISELGRVGGVGVKLHPLRKYVNLYHWLFGDELYIRGNVGHPLPAAHYAFSKSPYIY